MPLATRAIPTRYSTTPLWMTWAAATSLGVHGLVWTALGFAPQQTVAPRERSEVSFEIAPSRPVPEAREPLAEPPSQPEAQRVSQPLPSRRPEVAPQAKPQATDAPSPEPIDMSGVTLTNDLGSGFSMHGGNGQAREGALRVPASLVRATLKDPPRTAPASSAPRIVSLGDLSARPSPPALQGALERNYPAEARRRGLGGTATVRVRIDPDGLVRSVSNLDESLSGFGEACRRALRGSRWSAPRDRGGNAVATEVRYTCRFVVSP